MNDAPQPGNRNRTSGRDRFDRRLPQRIGRLASVLLAATLLSAGSASAVPPQLSLTVGVSPYTGGTAPAPVTLTLHTTTTSDPSEPPFSTRHMAFDLDPNIVTGFQAPAGCSRDQVIADATRCTPVGDGTMEFTTLGLTEHMTMAAFQSTDPQALLVLVDGRTPLSIHSVLTMQRTVNPLGGSHFDVDVPLGLQEPAPGAYATWTDFSLSLRSAIGLTGCPPSLLSFATHSDFTPGSSSADATSSVPCEVGTPVVPPVQVTAPFAPIPNLATRLARGHGRVLGKLLGLRSVRGMTTGTVTLTCTAGCAKRRLGSRTLHGNEQSPLIRLHPALSVTKRTRISVTMVSPEGSSRVQRFRFVRRSGGLIAKGM